MTRIVVHAKPGSSKQGVVRLDDESLEVRVNARAVDGEANKAIIVALAKYLGVPKSRLTIVRGDTAKIKVIEVGD